MTELTQGVSKLIERIKTEGLTKGQAEKDRMIAEAKNEAERIIGEAQSKADTIKVETQSYCDDLRTRLDAELRLSVRDFVAKFQKQIKDYIIRPVITEQISQIVSDERFLFEALCAILVDYTKSGGGQIEAIVDEEMTEKLGAFFTKALKDKLAGASDLTVTSQKGLTGFRLRRAGEGFSWDFTLEAIASELQALVEPQLKPFFTLETKKK